MRININTIEIHNFMSFQDEVFDFASQTGMNLVTGKNLDVQGSANAAGKTAFFSALLYGLYGQLANKIKSENISNRQLEDKEVRVVVHLDVDGQRYDAISGMNKRAQGYFTLKKEVDGEMQDITKSSIAETRNFFETEILHCDISLFLRTILLTSEHAYNFFYLRKQDKKEFIEKLFDVGIFGKMHELMHKDALAQEKQILAHQNQLLVLNQNEEKYKSKISEFEDQKRDGIAKLKIQISEAEANVAHEFSESAQTHAELLAKCNDAQQKLYDTQLQLNEQSAQVQANISKLQHEVQQNERMKNDRIKIVQKHAEIFDKLCKDCKKTFDAHYNLTTYNAEIAELTMTNSGLADKLNEMRASSAALDDKLSKLTAKMKQVAEKTRQLTSERDAVNAKKDAAERHLAGLKSKLEQLSACINPYSGLLDDVTSKIKSETACITSLGEDYAYLKKAESIVSQESIKKFIISDLIGLINNRIKTYLMKMGASFTCKFDDNLDYAFDTSSGACELFNFSCGEKKRLEIATCLAFRDFVSQRSNITSNILILDEYIDAGIDKLAVESVLDILKKISDCNQQNVFIISHRQEINNELFDRNLEVQKCNGISTVHIHCNDK